jgi:hypothetical protein
MDEESLFRIFDHKYKKWAGVRAENGRTFDQYWLEKFFKESNLIWCDLEGFAMTRPCTDPPGIGRRFPSRADAAMLGVLHDDAWISSPLGDRVTFRRHLPHE